MSATRTSDRFASAFGASIAAASLGFAIGMFGLLGFLVFTAYLPFMLMTAGSGTALAAWLLTRYMERRAAGAATRGELWRVALLIVLPPALLNIVPTLFILRFVLVPMDIRPLVFDDARLSCLLAALWGALGM